MNVCPKCHGELIGIEYSWDNPEHYDGISEWYCLKCDARFGRWTVKELKRGEIEPIYGIPHEVQKKETKTASKKRPKQSTMARKLVTQKNKKR